MRLTIPLRSDTLLLGMASRECCRLCFVMGKNYNMGKKRPNALMHESSVLKTMSTYKKTKTKQNRISKYSNDYR